MIALAGWHCDIRTKQGNWTVLLTWSDERVSEIKHWAQPKRIIDALINSHTRNSRNEYTLTKDLTTRVIIKDTRSFALTDKVDLLCPFKEHDEHLSWTRSDTYVKVILAINENARFSRFFLATSGQFDARKLSHFKELRLWTELKERRSVFNAGEHE